MEWTTEAMRAENLYRREQLHKLAGHRRGRTSARTGPWWKRLRERH